MFNKAKWMSSEYCGSAVSFWRLAKSAHHRQSSVVIFKYFGLIVFNFQAFAELLNAKCLVKLLNAKKK